MMDTLVVSQIDTVVTYFTLGVKSGMLTYIPIFAMLVATLIVIAIIKYSVK